MMFFEYEMAETPRLQVTYLHAGAAGKPKLVLLHDAVASADFFQPLMKCLEPYFELIAPDLRTSGHAQAKPVDATRGLRDFSDDLDALIETLGWDRFSILGWGLGAGIAMQFAADLPQRVESLILESPIPPYGLCGSFGETGEKPEIPGLGSGAGCADQRLAAALQKGDRDYVRTFFISHYLAPTTEIDEEFENLFVDSMLMTKTGEGFYPGSVIETEQWPGFAAGETGVCNAMSSRWCDLTPLLSLDQKPPILWIHGTGDGMISDSSYQDPAFLGFLSVRPGWPGLDKFPPQPMLRQTRHFLEEYKAQGGAYDEVVIAGGYCCMLDKESDFVYSLQCFMEVQLNRDFGLPKSGSD